MKDFDSSTLADSDKKILEDFQARRTLFNEYILKENLEAFTCPSCGYPTLTERGGYEICSICDWEDDNQDDKNADEVWGGPNGWLSLTESRLIIGRHLLAKATPGANSTIDPEKIYKLVKDGEQSIDAFVNALDPNKKLTGEQLQQYRDIKQSILSDEDTAK